ncbi:MAG: AsmA family protein [Burkholderiaceae bacterium]|nr:AsmA family protein [Burkholderiaceae bacterium]
MAGFAKPAITFDVALDQLKLDRFAAAGSSSNKSSPGNSTANSRGSTEATSAAAPATASGKANAIDLAGLKGHNIKGKLRVGKVLSKGLTIDQVQADVLLNQGKLSVSPHSAQLFGGKLAGSLAIDANTNQFALKENISGIKLESLLTALGQEPKVTGQGSLTLDLMTSGTTVKALEQNLSGNASVNLKDGAVKGIDIGAIINNVRSMLGKAPTQQGTGSGETAFTDLTASATIQNGIATNRDLNVKAPLFRLEGAGTVNIPNSTVDYLAKVAVVETSTGQGGKDLAALRGVTIPIKISGKFDSPQYSVDVGSLAAELAKSQLGDKARDEINKVVPGLGDALKGLFGR